MQTQSLGVISVNLWDVLISLANLGLLYWLFKRFLFDRVRKVLDQRQAALDKQYADAAQAQQQAEKDQAAWAAKLGGAQAEADTLLKNAADTARRTGDTMVAEAKERAEGIVRQAEEDARLEHLKAEEGIRRELADLSTELAEKVLGREINEADHRSLMDAFIGELGETDDGDQ